MNLLATTEAGDIFDDAIVEIYLQNATPQEAFQELRIIMKKMCGNGKIRWTEEKQMHRQRNCQKMTIEEKISQLKFLTSDEGLALNRIKDFEKPGKSTFY